MRKTAVFIALVLLLVLGATPALAAGGVPKLPHAFFGSVTVNGVQASDGTQVSATVNIGEIISTQNPVTTVGGNYGIGSPYLLVQGYDIPDGATITFHVTNANGMATGGTASFVAGGGPTQKNLSVTITAPAPTVTAIAPASGPTAGGTPVTITGTNFVSGATVTIGGNAATGITVVSATSITATTPAGTAGAKDVVVTTPGGAFTLTGGFTYVAPAPSGGGAPSQPPVQTNLFGATGSFNIGADGKITQTISAVSQDGKLTITIPVGTIAKDKNGNPLSSLTAVVNASPPPPPAGANIIGLAYNFGPDGATFNPPITFTWSYDPAALPTGVAEEDLVIAYYDATAGKWVELQGVVDAANNKITASVSHFTTFAIIGTVKLPPPPAPVPAAFSLSKLTVQPAEVQPGELVTITVSVANTGGTEGSYTVVLKLNGVKEAEKSVIVAAGKSQDVSFSVSREAAGSYAVAVGGLTGSFKVVAPPTTTPAAFSVTNLSIQPTEVQPNEPITITMSVANTGGTEGNYTVVLKVNEVKEAEKIVTVAAGKSQEVSFSVTREEPGSYTVTVDGLSGSFAVAEAPPVKPPVNWSLIGGIIAAIVVVVLVVFFLLRRKAAKPKP